MEDGRHYASPKDFRRALTDRLKRLTQDSKWELYRTVAAETAAQELRAASALHLGDWFEFEVGAAQPVRNGGAGLRLPVKALVGGTV